MIFFGVVVDGGCEEATTGHDGIAVMPNGTAAVGLLCDEDGLVGSRLRSYRWVDDVWFQYIFFFLVFGGYVISG